MASEFSDVIGSETTIKGDVSGKEPLLVRGAIEGSVKLDSHLLVGSEGRVSADVRVNALTVEGTLEGKVQASEVVTIRAGATVRGDVEAPRLIIEDEALFTGRIVMDVKLPEGVKGPDSRTRG